MQKKCFVIMPFSKTSEAHDKKYWDEFYDVLENIINDCGYDCKRSDPTPNNIMNKVVDQLKNSEIVVAVLTDYNSNVWYELGIRHTFKKRGTVMLIENDSPWPFDIQAYGLIHYDSTTLKGQNNIRLKIKGFIEEIGKSNRPDNAVHNYLEWETSENEKVESKESVKNTPIFTEIKKEDEFSSPITLKNKVDIIWYNIDLDINKETLLSKYQETQITTCFVNNINDFKTLITANESKLVIISSNNFDSVNETISYLKNLNESLLLKRIIIYSNNPLVIKKTEDILKEDKILYLTSSLRSLFQFVKININK